jgi:trimeric autotransporter adhesin
MSAFYRLLFVALLWPYACLAQYNPNVTARSTPVCEDQPIYLYAQWTPPPTGTTATFFWSGPNSYTSNSFTPSVPYSAAAMSGPYSLTIAYTGNNTGFATSSVTPTLGTPKVSASGRTTDSPYWSKAVVSCTPNSLSLTADFQGHPASTTYLWTGPNSYSSSSRSPVVTGLPVPAGQYTITATFPGTCGVSRDTVSLSTPQLPALRATSSIGGGAITNTFCPNSPVNLGVGTSGSTTAVVAYVWTTPTGLTVGTGTSITVTSPNVAAGSIAYQVRGYSSCGTSTSATTTVNTSNGSVNAVGRVNAAYNSYITTCAATSYSLAVNVAQPPIIAFTWSGPNNFTSTLNQPIVTGTLVPPGAYSVVVTHEGGCTSKGVATLQYGKPYVYMDYKPEVRTCAGIPITLTASLEYGPPTVNYTWRGPNGFISNGATITVSNPSTGLYYADAVYSGACSGTATNSIQVIVGPPPVTPTGKTSWSNAYLIAAATCPTTRLDLTTDIPTSVSATYSWAGPNGFVSNSATPFVEGSPVPAGAYSVSVTFPSGCGTSTAWYSLIYKKPTLTIYTGDYKPGRFCPGAATSLLVLASAGNIPFTAQWAGPGNFSAAGTTVNVPNVQAGIYSVTATFPASCSANPIAVKELTTGPPPITVQANALSGQVLQSKLYDDDVNYACVGTVVQLTASPTSGTPVAYRWQGPNSFTGVSSQVTLPAMTSDLVGIYSVTAMYGGTCQGYSTELIRIAARPAPNLIAQWERLAYSSTSAGGTTDYKTPLAICEGTYLKMEASTFGSEGRYGINLLWEGPNSFTANTASIIIANLDPAKAGRYVLTTTYGLACNNAVVKDTTYVLYGVQPPTIRATQRVVSAGSSITLYADNCKSSYAYKIVWSNGMVGQSITVVPTETTTYRATCTINICTSNPSEPLTVTVLNTPIADIALRMRTDRHMAGVGEPISVTITAVNEGTATVNNLQVLSRLPASLIVQNMGTMQVITDGVKGSISSLAAGMTQDLTFTITQHSAGSSRLAAQLVSSDNPDVDSWPNSGTNDGQDDVAWVDIRTTQPGGVAESPEPYPAVLPPASPVLVSLPDGLTDLGLLLKVSNAAPKPGDVVSVSLIISNEQARRMLTPSLRCLLPAGLTFLGGTGASATGQQVYIAGGDYFCDPFITYQFLVQAVGTGDKTLVAEIQTCDWPDTDSTPGNGIDNGEDDTGKAYLRVR